MDKLNLENFFIKSDEWNSKHTEYIEELIKLNSNNASDMEFVELKDKYGNYTNAFYAPYYTDITEEFIQKQKERGIILKNAEILLKEFNEHRNKIFLDKYSNQEFILSGLITTFEDYYWVGKCKTGKKYFFSCIESLNFV